MNRKLLSMFIAFCIASMGCHNESPQGDGPQDDHADTGASPTDDTLEVELARQLVPATWPDDAVGVEVYQDEVALMIVVENADGDPIARVALREHAPEIYDLVTEFADGKGWATLDMQNDALVQRGTSGLDDEEFESRAAAIVDTVEAIPQEGPWLDCVLAVLDAVITCIPAVGVLVVCPQKIKTAVCKCLQAAKKKKKC